MMPHDDLWTQNNKQYFQDRFAHICLKSRSMEHVEMPWPGKDVIDTLVRRACGQFLYAATVPKFVPDNSKLSYVPILQERKHFQNLIAYILRFFGRIRTRTC